MGKIPKGRCDEDSHRKGLLQPHQHALLSGATGQRLWEEKAWRVAWSLPGGIVQPPPGARVWERTAQKTHASSPHHTRVSQRLEAAGQIVWGQSEPQARTGTQAQAGGSSKAWVGPEASVQRPRALGASRGLKSTATDPEGDGVGFQEVV